MAFTSAIGLGGEPQPPMPTVMPSSISPTTSSAVITLSVNAIRGLRPRTPSVPGSLAFAPSRFELGVPLLDERLARLVGHAAQVELEREALFEAVAALHIN